MTDVTSTDATFLLVGTADGAGEALADELTRRGAMVEWAELSNARDVAFVLAPELVVLWGEVAGGGGAVAIERLRAEALDPDILLAVVVAGPSERALAEAAGANAGVPLEGASRLADNLIRVLAGQAPVDAPAEKPAAPAPPKPVVSPAPKAEPPKVEPPKVEPPKVEPKSAPAPLGAPPKITPTAKPVVSKPLPAPAKPAPRPASVRPRPLSVPPPAAFAAPEPSDELALPALPPPPVLPSSPGASASPAPPPASPAPPPAALVPEPRSALPLPPGAVVDARARADATPVAAPAEAELAASRAAAIEAAPAARPAPAAPAPSAVARAEPEVADDWSNLPSFGIAPPSQPPSATPAAAVPVLVPPAAPLPRSERPPAPSPTPVAPPSSERPPPASPPGWLLPAAGVGVLVVVIGLAAWALRGEGPPPSPPPAPPAAPAPPPVVPPPPETAETEPAPTPPPEDRDEEDLSPRERIDRLILAANYNRQHGAPARAEEDYRAVLEIEPRNPRAMVGLTRLATSRGDHAGAVEWARRLTTEHPRVASHFVVLGDALAASGDRDAARRAYEQALAISPTLETAQSRLDGM